MLKLLMVLFLGQGSCWLTSGLFLCLQEADTDDNQGTLDFDEFCAFYKMMSTRRDLYLLMLTYSNHKDYLDADDLKRFLDAEQKVRSWAGTASKKGTFIAVGLSLHHKFIWRRLLDSSSSLLSALTDWSRFSRLFRQGSFLAVSGDAKD